MLLKMYVTLKCTPCIKMLNNSNNDNNMNNNTTRGGLGIVGSQMGERYMHWLNVLRKKVRANEIL